jgi:hypothetical protein
MSDEASQNHFKAIPPLPGEQATPPSGSEPTSGEREAAALAAGTLEEQSKKSEHQRNERLRNHTHNAIVYLIWLSFCLIVVGLLSSAWHHLLPLKWGWLSETQLSVLDTFIFSGALVSVVGRYIMTRIFN